MAFDRSVQWVVLLTKTDLRKTESLKLVEDIFKCIANAANWEDQYIVGVIQSLLDRLFINYNELKFAIPPLMDEELKAVSLDARNYGRNFLHDAARQRKCPIGVLEVLINAGVDVNAVAKFGINPPETVLGFAIGQHSPEKVSFLLKHGAKVDFMHSSFKMLSVTPYWFQPDEKDSIEVANLLLEAKADVHAVEEGETPLAAALRKRGGKNPALIEWLFNKNIEDDIEDEIKAPSSSASVKLDRAGTERSVATPAISPAISSPSVPVFPMPTISAPVQPALAAPLVTPFSPPPSQPFSRPVTRSMRVAQVGKFVPVLSMFGASAKKAETKSTLSTPVVKREVLTTEDIMQAAITLSGSAKSKARFNCSHYAKDMVNFLVSGIQPTKKSSRGVAPLSMCAVIDIPASGAGGGVSSFSVFPIKEESDAVHLPPYRVEGTLTAERVPEGAPFVSLEDEHKPSESVLIDLTSEKLSPESTTSYRNISAFLGGKAAAERKILIGLIIFRCVPDGTGRDFSGHVIPFYAVPEKNVIYVDCQAKGDKKVFFDIENQYNYLSMPEKERDPNWSVFIDDLGYIIQYTFPMPRLENESAILKRPGCA